MKQEKGYERIIIAFILAVAFMISSFAIAYSMRYKVIGDTMLFDQWKKTIYLRNGNIYKQLQSEAQKKKELKTRAEKEREYQEILDLVKEKKAQKEQESN